jgi:hypothetical protein
MTVPPDIRPLSGLKLDSPVLRFQKFGVKIKASTTAGYAAFICIVLDEIKTNHNRDLICNSTKLF